MDSNQQIQFYNNNNYGLVNGSNGNSYHLQIPQQQQTQLIQQHQQQYSFINRSKSPTNRPKSPPSMHSPPMSPINRMPLSPKSPRQRQSNILMNINLNNSNTNNNNNNNLSNNVGYQKSPIMPNTGVCTKLNF